MEINQMEIKQEKKGSRTLVKCLICGEIFDSSLEICPVCKAGKEHFVPYTEDKGSYKNNTKEIFVILGNGAAGISAATAIRERNETCSIILISNEAVLGYNRPMLTKSLVNLTSGEEIAIHDQEWYTQKNIINVLNKKVEKIDAESKEVQLSDGIKFKYDKCIYALGSESFIPPIQGRDKPEVIAIRRMSDVDKINKLIPEVKNVVVIGGGVLGLEAAWEVSKKCKVTILEVADKLMGRQLDNEAGELLADIIQSLDIDFRLNAKIEEITGETSVTGVKLDTGEVIPAELVLISSGVRPNTAIAREAGLEIGKAVMVNEKMETSKTDIYACGDCAEYQGVNYAIWPQALEMGKVAGANAAGDSLAYENVPALLTFSGMNTSLFAAGDNGKNPDLVYTSKEIKDLERKTYEKYYFVDNRLTGVILLGDISKLGQMSEAILEKKEYDKMF